MADQSVNGDNNIQVLVKESENVHIDIRGERVALLWVPPFRVQLQPGNTKDLNLLLASSRSESTV